mmetsp:Transcript_9339/g.18212  ORF Transcript_9339/g.18212 Transcript_9339/m.18212 type:complete len:117 (+) Transcript_9339:628-978(+)
MPGKDCSHDGMWKGFECTILNCSFSAAAEVSATNSIWSPALAPHSAWPEDLPGLAHPKQWNPGTFSANKLAISTTRPGSLGGGGVSRLDVALRVVLRRGSEMLPLALQGEGFNENT